MAGPISQTQLRLVDLVTKSKTLVTNSRSAGGGNWKFIKFSKKMELSPIDRNVEKTQNFGDFGEIDSDIVRCIRKVFDFRPDAYQRLSVDIAEH